MPCSWPQHPPPTNRDRLVQFGRKLGQTSVLVVYAAAAALIVWTVMHVPEMAATRARADAREMLAVDRENHTYCEKWGMREGTHEHTLCVLDLQALRQKDQRRVLGVLGSNAN